MTPQDVMKNFMASLANHGYSNSTSIGTNMLDSAIRASSRYSSATDAITAMKADQVAAEKAAVQEVLGSSYAGKTMSEVSSDDILTESAKNYDTGNTGNGYYDQYNDGRTTVERLIKERKAIIFLRDYCGIVLENNYYLNSSDKVTSWSGKTTGNTDTGAITGSDAGGSTVKTPTSVVPETFANTYKAAENASAQTIVTDNRNRVIQATDNADTITSNGADSINACAGDDQITANANGATITTGDGNDQITVANTVNDIILSDLDSSDTLTIGGTFEAGSAQIVDGLLVVTDKTGNRKIRFDNYESAYNAKINSTTVKSWLTTAGIDLNNLTSTNYYGGSSSSSGDVVVDDGGRIALTPDNVTPAPVEVSYSSREVSNSDENISDGDGTESTSFTVNGISVDTSQTGNVVDGSTTLGTVSSEFPNASTFTRNGLTIHLLGESSDGSTNNITAKTFDELTDGEKNIVAGLFKWWTAETLTLNEESYGIDFNSSTATIKDIGLYFYTNSSSNTLAAVSHSRRNADGEVISLYLNVNMAYYANIAATDMDGTASTTTAGLLDRTLAHEFTHAIMAANINYFGTLPQFIKEGSAELTHGIDDERGNVIFALGYDSDSLASALSLTDSGTGNADCYAGGYMFLRWLAKKSSAETLPAFGEITATVTIGDEGDGIWYINGTSKNETAQFANSLPEGKILLGTVSNGVYTVNNSGVHQVISGINKVSGLTVNDTFTGTDNADTVTTAQGSNISTGNGADSIDIYGQFATISAGAGADTVNVKDGSHHSINLGDGNNLLNLQTESSYNNTITGGTGNDTVADASGSHYEHNHVINLGDGNNLVSFHYGEYNFIATGIGKDTVSVGGGTNNTVITGAGDDFIEVLSSNHIINSGADNDFIQLLGSNNTITAGTGDDTISQYSNSEGGNVYLFDTADFGSDRIDGFKSTDTIKLADGFTFDVSDVTQFKYTNSSNETLGTGERLTVTVKSGNSNVGTITI